MPDWFQADSMPIHGRVGVARREGIYRVIAIEPIPAGALILRIEGIFVEASILQRSVAAPPHTRSVVAGVCDRLSATCSVKLIEPSRWSIQVGEGLHVEPPRELLPDLEPDRCPWRFLNHSCAPNAVLGSACRAEGSPLRLIALRSIDRWEEISFDYNSNEFELAAPFACACGACGGGVIRGFRHLDPVEQARRRERVSPHLLTRLERAG